MASLAPSPGGCTGWLVLQAELTVGTSLPFAGLLSLGERQRITIARTLLKDPRILVLHEATSALDAESQEAVQMAMMALTRGRTTFVIAHRLTTLVHADQIVVLKTAAPLNAARIVT